MQTQLHPEDCNENTLTGERRRPDSGRGLVWTLCLLFAFSAFTVMLQFRNGAYSTGFEGYPDEAAHYVTGVMVRDYMVSGVPRRPTAFAEQYYNKYPKIGLGHWPPFFYIAEAMWMVVFSTSRGGTLVLMAFISGVLATLVAVRLRSEFGIVAGIAGGLLLLLLREMQRQSAMVMPEILVALFGFAAIVAFAGYIEEGLWRDSVLFAVFSSACILTKGNGWALVLVPVLALPLAGRLDLLRRLSLWIPAIGVGVICIAWQLFSQPYIRHVWEAAVNVDRLQYYSRHAVLVSRQLGLAGGVAVLLLACIGIAKFCVAPLVRGRFLSGHWAVLAACIPAVWVFHVFTPLDVELRKMLLGLGPVVIFAVAGAVALSRSVPAAWRVPVCLAAAAAVIAPNLAPATKPNSGVIEAAQVMLGGVNRPTVFFVSGASSIEGALIAEVLMNDPRREHTILRASKAMASSDWNGTAYRARFQTEDQVSSFLDGRSVALVAVDSGKNADSIPHHSLLRRALAQYPQHWQPEPYFSPNAVSDQVKVFRRTADRR